MSIYRKLAQRLGILSVLLAGLVASAWSGTTLDQCFAGCQAMAQHCESLCSTVGGGSSLTPGHKVACVQGCGTEQSVCARACELAP
jgi:hypothetical protein